jgi:hypothetical protein
VLAVEAASARDANRVIEGDGAARGATGLEVAGLVLQFC